MFLMVIMLLSTYVRDNSYFILGFLFYFIAFYYKLAPQVLSFTCTFPDFWLFYRNLLPITHVCIEEGEKPMVILPYMNWGNLKLFLRQCKLVEANNPQVRKFANYRLFTSSFWYCLWKQMFTFLTMLCVKACKKKTTLKVNQEMSITCWSGGRLLYDSCLKAYPLLMLKFFLVYPLCVYLESPQNLCNTLSVISLITLEGTWTRSPF